MRPTNIRRHLAGFVLIVFYTTIALLGPAGKALAAPQIKSVGAIGMTVSDADRSIEFFTKVLDFQKISETEFHDPQFDRLTGIFGARVRVVTLRLGRESIELTEYITLPGKVVPADSRSNDLWFQHVAIVVPDMDAALARLRQFKVKPISTAPQQLPEWNTAAAGIRAFYFRDPDNHALELIYFPPGKGDPRWQVKADRLFLGIDHTAIAVGDSENSLQFYRDLLGLKVAGESLNYGSEQEHLNHVFGARVRITGLRAPEGPGIEFLEYLTPRDGRPYPPDAKASDLIHWYTTLHTEGAAEIMQRLVSHKARSVSGGILDVGVTGLERRRAGLVRDPDGHALMLAEP